MQISAVYVTEEDRQASHRAGADAYMTGPVDVEALAASLRKLLAERSSAAP